MGRITNSIGLRLGTQLPWKCTGIRTKKYNCINYYNLNIYLNYFIKTGNIFDNQYLIAQIQLLQYQEKAIVNIFFYMKNILPFLIKKTKKKLISKLLKKYLLIGAFKKNKTLQKIFLLRKKRFRKKKLYRKKYLVVKKVVGLKNRFKYSSVNVGLSLKRYTRVKNSFLRSFGIVLHKIFRVIKKDKKFKFFFKRVLFVILKLVRAQKISIYKNFKNSLDFLKLGLYTQRLGLKKALNAYRFLNIKKNISLISTVKSKKIVIKNIIVVLFLKILNFNIQSLAKVNTKKIYKFFYKQEIQNNNNLKIIKYRYNLVGIQNNLRKFTLHRISKLLFARKFSKFYNYTNNKFLVEFLCLEKTILQVIKLYTKEDIVCKFNFVSNYNYTAQLLVTYIAIKLKQKFTINQIIRPLSKFLQKLIKKNYLYGYKFQLKGRFTRKQRATKFTLKGGSVPLAMLNVQIDYFSDIVCLKDGVGGIKIWLHKTKKLQNTVLSLKN